MFAGHIQHTSDEFYSATLQRVLAYLRETDFLALAAGKYPLGNDIIANVMDIDTQPDELVAAEIHHRNIDVHFLCRGHESQAFVADNGTNTVTKDRLADNDILFYAPCANESFISLTPGQYTVYFPNDIHRPGIQSVQLETIRKVVVKIPVDIFNQ